MPTTSRLALPYPATSDAATSYRTSIQGIATALDSAAIDLHGTRAARPAASQVGRYYFIDDELILCRDTGSAWVEINAKRLLRTVHTWTVLGPTANALNVPSMFMSLAAGQATNIVGVRAKIGSGTSIAVQLTKNGVNVGGAVTVTTAAATTSLGPTAVASNDDLDIVLSAATGNPADLSYTLILEHSI